MEVEAKDANIAFDELRKIDGTIRVRSLHSA